MRPRLQRWTGSGWTALAALCAVIVLTSVPAEGRQSNGESVIIHTSGNLGQLRKAIEDAGGTVTAAFEQLGSVAADIPVDAIESLADQTGLSVMKDILVAAPGDGFTPGGRDGSSAAVQSALDNIPFDQALPLTAAEVDLTAFATNRPGAYQINHAADRVRDLHALGLTGNGVTVAVIDTGLRPGFGALNANQIAGCFTVLPGDNAGCINPSNDGHGTMVSGLIAGQAIYTFKPKSSVFLHSVGQFAPGAPMDLNGDGLDEAVALVGSAPGARILMLKAFADGGTPTSASVIIAAVDAVIDLKLNHGFSDIRVANMSFGSFTLEPGHNPLDLAVDALLANGIVPVVAAGNTGPALITAGSPASSLESIAVGAGSLAHQERIAADVGFFDFPGAGDFLRVFDGAQTAWFSARGPHADGRTGPDLMADGWVVGSGLGSGQGKISIASGTSFSAPDVAGIAAMLAEAAPGLGRNATDIRNAVVAGANPSIIQNGSTAADQGRGWVDAAAAYNLLLAGQVPNPMPPAGVPGPVALNLPAGLDVEPAIVSGKLVEAGPGQRQDLIYDVLPNTAELQVTISDVHSNLNACTPSLIFEEEIRLAIHTAKTSAFPPDGFYYDLNPTTNVHGFISVADLNLPNAAGMPTGSCGDGTCKVRLGEPETGLARISLSGATENGCPMSARVSIVAIPVAPAPAPYASGSIQNGDVATGSVMVPKKVKELIFTLRWSGDWGRFPANDLDLFVAPGPSQPVGNGATLNSPEVISIHNPTPGSWNWAVIGFAVDLSDDWELVIEADGIAIAP